MRISYDWLKEFINHDLDYGELMRTLTMIGLESDAADKMECEFDSVIVAKITKIDKTEGGNIITFDTGQGDLKQVFCTAPNVEVGMLAPYAAPGTTIKGIKVEQKKFGDFVSNGVLCSSEELGIGRDSTGLLPLCDPLKVGDDLKEYLFGDLPIEIELVSNRGDQYSFLGIARELAVHLGLPIQEIEYSEASETIEGKGDSMAIEIPALDLCPLYTFRMFNDAIVCDSPPQILRKLIALGLKPINNIVDITNIVLYELGQPLHPFDRTLLKGNSVIVRRAKPKEKFTTLDDVERKLDKNDLLIADESGGIALGGVMGGLLSEINWKTRTVLLESALFEKVGIRRTSRRHALRSDASVRFERGVDPDMVMKASARVAWYVEKLNIGTPSPTLVYTGQMEYPKNKFTIRVPRIEQCLGYKIPYDDMNRILTGLGFDVNEIETDKWELTVPKFRSDVVIEEDVAEEVARHHGYNAIEGTLPRIQMGRDLLHEYDSLKMSVRYLLAGWGLYEVISFALGNRNELGRTHFLRPGVKRVDINNPLTEEHACLRTNIEETMLDVLASNYKKRTGLRDIFEIGRGYWRTDEGFAEKDELCIILSVEGIGKSVKNSEEDLFLQLKGLVIELLKHLKITNYKLAHDDNPGEFADVAGDAFMAITTDNTKWGYVRLVPNDELDRRDAQLIAVSATLDWETLLALHQESKGAITLDPLPRFPASKRDLALSVPDDVKYEDIEKTILESGGEILVDLNLFDIYRGKQVEKGHISIAVNLTFQDRERTLTDEIVDERISSILKALEKSLGVRLRDK
ncbi:phenylalanine--tRNA ligase subunit beta [bacterium]|nr:phenylalanine--tRNA ligase subunit beta [bacterium]